MMQLSKQRLRELQADLCTTMANATRLAILECLHTGEKNVTDIRKAVGATITAVSQHLRVLRDKHVVVARKDGQTVFYRLRDPRMIDACHLIRAVLMDGMKQNGELARGAAPRRRPRA
jgi:DNA-binding transcriptional ArsR family regulator